jgi:murein L,D-transpeptidase YcbB/YkuD
LTWINAAQQALREDQSLGSGKSMRYLWAWLFGLSLALGGISVDAADQKATIASAVQTTLSKAGALDGFEDAADVRRFYEMRSYAPAWQLSGNTAQDAAHVIAALNSAPDDGLDARDYGLPAPCRPAVSDATCAANWDIGVTANLMRYGRDLLEGRLRSSSKVSAGVAPLDLAARLNEAIAKRQIADFLSSLAPADPDYRRLKTALTHYRKIEQSGGWRGLPSAQELKGWTEERRNEALMARLRAEDATMDSFNADRALRRFQERNGLEVDGKPGPKTIAALNVPVQDHIEQIVLNLERRRNLAWELEPDRIEVNVAAGTLRVLEARQEILASRVIVGSRTHPSPVVRAMASGVTVNPAWNVPASIARREILPKLRRDRDFLQSQNMILLNGPEGDPYGLSIDWSKVSPTRFPYRIRQLPGQTNSLGSVKIEMPNGFDVYLHDTPAKNLFSQSERFFSHGCVRVQEIYRLASFLLSGDPEAKVEDLRAITVEGGTRRLAAKTALPVYLLYWTAIAEADEAAAGFRSDVYGRDARLLEALRTLRRDYRSNAVMSQAAISDPHS